MEKHLSYVHTLYNYFENPLKQNLAESNKRDVGIANKVLIFCWHLIEWLCNIIRVEIGPIGQRLFL